MIMKINILLMILFSFISTVSSFSQIPEKWMQWTKTNCYENIEYRARYVQTNGNRHEWQIQFRNNFNRMVVFNYGIEENPEALALTTHRKTLRSHETSEPINIFTENENFLLFTNKLSFAVDGSDAIPCDR